MSSIAEVFPHDDPVACFVMAMSIARNDVRHAVERAVGANERDEPEFTYYARLSMAHYFEALDAVDHWCTVAPVQAFMARLPREGQQELRRARSRRQQIGHAAIEHSRNRTFHYPSPASPHHTDAELSEVLRLMGDEDATVVITGEGYYRLHFADTVALTLAFAKYAPERARDDARRSIEGAAAFVNFATTVWWTYVRTRDLEGVPLPPPP